MSRWKSVFDRSHWVCYSRCEIRSVFNIRKRPTQLWIGLPRHSVMIGTLVWMTSTWDKFMFIHMRSMCSGWLRRLIQRPALWVPGWAAGYRRICSCFRCVWWYNLIYVCISLQIQSRGLLHWSHRSGLNDGRGLQKLRWVLRSMKDDLWVTGGVVWLEWSLVLEIWLCICHTAFPWTAQCICPS